MGPCLCGDPFCPSCGNPHAAELEAAEEWAINRLGEAGLVPEEYRAVVEVGLAALPMIRQQAALIAEVASEAEFSVAERMVS